MDGQCPYHHGHRGRLSVGAGAIIFSVKPRLYLETTVVSYYVARQSRDLVTAAHQQLTQEWWIDRRLDFEVYISQLVLQEASMGDDQAIQRRLQILEGLPLPSHRDLCLLRCEQ